MNYIEVLGKYKKEIITRSISEELKGYHRMGIGSQTNKFYKSLSFKELEVIKSIWDSKIHVKYI